MLIQVFVNGVLQLEGNGEVEDDGEGTTEYIVTAKNVQYIVQVPEKE